MDSKTVIVLEFSAYSDRFQELKERATEKGYAFNDMAAKTMIESGKTNYLHDVEYAAMQAMREDVKKAISIFANYN